jgi:type II secretory ATPase GspE/PulE/Tfp pilus assembly ATPase PilB-like protein
MNAPPTTGIAEQLAKLDGASPLYATQFVELLLAAARAAGASDVHLQPTGSGLLVQWRIDGVLQRLGEFPRGQAADAVVRLKVLAELLTYRTDAPQEGRIRGEGLGPGARNEGLGARARQEQATSGDSPALAPGPSSSIEMRVSTFPTLHGERAVVRLFAAESQYLYVSELGLPEEIGGAVVRLTTETSGAVLLTGPAGSGKTTTAYACLREIVRSSDGQRSIVTLEDPIEVAVEGVSQSQAAPAAGFTLAAGLRSLMRQDPEVILVGEIRDAETVATVFQAALTGHLVFSTLHAGSAVGALSRLSDMGIEPYVLISGLRAVLHQRLMRKLCACEVDGKETLGLPVTKMRQAVGCDACRHTGYRGRLALAEMLPPLAGELAAAVKDRRDARELARIASDCGMTAIFARACAAVESGRTDAAEVRRVLGFTDGSAAAI